MNKFKLIILLTLSAGITKGQSQIRFTEIRPPYKSISPIVGKLRNNKIDETEFWHGVQQTGLRIIETDSLYSDYVWITLCYGDSTTNKKISFDIYGIYSEYRFGDMKLHRRKDSNLYYRSYMVPNDLCFSYRFIIEDTVTQKVTRDIDRFNKNRIPTGGAKSYSYSVLDLRADEVNWNIKADNSTLHAIDTLQFKSEILNNQRNVYVYLPPHYDKKKKEGYPIIYLFDSFIYLNRVEVPNILENLVRSGRLDPMLAVFIENPSRTSRKTELPLNPSFKEAIVTELVPLINRDYNTTAKPEKTIIGGISYGGLAATYISFYHAEIFGKVLSQSGGFWRDKALTDNFGNEIRNDWLINQFLRKEPKPIKIFLDWGLQENMVLGANRKFARALDAKGYQFKFIEFNGWHDWSNSRKTFPAGLLYLAGSAGQ